jgi:hypothetical protein
MPQPPQLAPLQLLLPPLQQHLLLRLLAPLPAAAQAVAALSPQAPLQLLLLSQQQQYLLLQAPLPAAAQAVAALSPQAQLLPLPLLLLPLPLFLLVLQPHLLVLQLVEV